MEIFFFLNVPVLYWMVKRIYLVSFLKQSAPYVFKPIDNLPIIRNLGKPSVIWLFSTSTLKAFVDKNPVRVLEKGAGLDSKSPVQSQKRISAWGRLRMSSFIRISDSLSHPIWKESVKRNSVLSASPFSILTIMVGGIKGFIVYEIFPESAIYTNTIFSTFRKHL